MSDHAEYRLELRGVTKQFPGVLTNDQVSFAVKPGEIHALLGENGAGKSTLVKMIYGVMQPDAGEIFGIAGVAGNGQNELLLALGGEIPANSADAISSTASPSATTARRCAAITACARCPKNATATAPCPTSRCPTTPS